MVYLKSIGAVTQNELQAVGYRCQDLALLHQNQIPIAGSFVVLSNTLDEVIRLGNLKYKIDYVMSHAQPTIPSSLQNVYSSARKALLEAKLPPGFEAELRDHYERIATPPTVGELVAQRPAVRIVMSTNRTDDPESNDCVIQNVNSFDELLVALREAWALSWHPTFLGPRIVEHFPENRLKVALIVQTMDEPVTSTHAYSSLPQDHKKVYLQVYYGFPDMRERITKDYYAISKDTMHVIATQTRPQPSALQRSGGNELVPVPLASGSGDKMADRDLAEIARLTKKAERLLQHPVKAFFVSTQDMHELLWVNRLGFDVLLGQESATPTTPAASSAAPADAPQIVKQLLGQIAEDRAPMQAPVPEPAPQLEVVDVADDFIMPTEQPAAAQQPPSPQPPTQHVSGVAAKLLTASLRIVHQVVERKYRGAFGETDATGNLSDMINRLNSASVFSRPVDGALLLQAEEAAKSGSNISEAEYAKAIEEVAFLMTYA